MRERAKKGFVARLSTPARITLALAGLLIAVAVLAASAFWAVFGSSVDLDIDGRDQAVRRVSG